MALTFWQRVRVAMRGWSRRREDEAKRRQEEFLRKNAAWGAARPRSAGEDTRAPKDVPAPKGIDTEGLQAAFLDSSGAIAYYLDLDSGEVVERAAAEAPLPEGRYRRVPARTAQSDAEDRAMFAAAVENARLRQLLTSAGDAAEFRRALAADRAAERAWYNFKNDRATSAIDSWLRNLGLR